MAGLIKREDIDEVRQRSRIDNIVREHVQLQNAGSGSLKGLCPFHDERTPSFHVRPELGVWHCFGCGEGGDVINFVQKINHLDFINAVEYLAERLGFQLHYEKGSTRTRDTSAGSLRRRIAQAHEVAETFYREQLGTPQAQQAREFLKARGFERQAVERFGVGYAPQGWENLLRHLRKNGFTEPELEASGLASRGQRGIYDRFRGRLMWPIRDITGTTVGFGARKLSDDDNGPKYLNTPETPLYKKSHVLYGLDLAKKDISNQRKVIIVEGYTDVMACHMAGLTTAVATCGTAFGADHVAIIRRLLGDRDDMSQQVMLSSGRTSGGQVIFTFDGDEAGRKAALRAFQEDQKFAAQTYVAIESSGKDPCELWNSGGDSALRHLIDTKEPLFEFVIHTILRSVDLSTAEGRVAGARAVAPVVAGIKDNALRNEYVRQVAGWVNMPEREVAGIIRQHGRVHPARASFAAQHQGRQGGNASHGGQAGHVYTPGLSNDPVVRTEEQALQVVLQRPFDLIGSNFDQCVDNAFIVPKLRVIHEAVRATGGIHRFKELLKQARAFVPEEQKAVDAATTRFHQEIINNAPQMVHPIIRGLMVAPLPQDENKRIRDYSQGIVHAVMKMGLNRVIADRQAQLRRTHSSSQQYREIFEDLLRLEQQKRNLDLP
ncbi:MAG: DNA primase [Actinomycetaceae bacterium]|nr:DNA primase [Actinomycetaceae bacterium]